MATRAPRSRVESISPAATPTDEETWPVQIMRKADGTLGVAIDGAKTLAETESEETAADRVAIAIADVTGDARAYVRIAKLERGKYAWCTDYTPQQYEDGGLSMLRDDWGAGEYDIRLYATNPNGLFNVRAKTSIVIVGARNGQQINHAPVVDPTVKAALEAILASQQSIAQALAQKPATPDPMAQFQQFLTVMASMRGVLGVDAAPVAPKSASLADQIREAREISTLLGDGNDSDNMLAQLAPIVDLVKTAMNKPDAANIPIVTMPPSIQMEQPAPMSTISNTPAVKAPAFLNATPTFSETMAQFLRMAESNGIPADAAGFLADNIPDTYIDQFANLLDSEEWWKALVEIMPGIAPYETWAVSVRAELLPMLFEADEVAVQQMPPMPG